ncbi:MAG: hypothetical protein CMJ78_03620 [Planctomycetaceae bacterium]|nr:hypothetical protein [Planctomycetaceae bacterium]
MTDDEYPSDESSESESEENSPQTQEVQHSQVSALVPEQVAKGAFSTGAVVLNGSHEFILDFLLRMTRPHQVVSRVVMPPAVVPQMIQALKQNVENYQRRFGPIPPVPQPLGEPQQPQGQQQNVSAQDLYDQLKFADHDMSGAYANAVMIGHSATEFSFDFITTFFPRSVVSSRVYLAASNVPKFLESLSHSFDQYQKKVAEAQQRAKEQQDEEDEERPF